MINLRREREKVEVDEIVLTKNQIREISNLIVNE